jgi:hypothetical protein
MSCMRSGSHEYRGFFGVSRTASVDQLGISAIPLQSPQVISRTRFKRTYYADPSKSLNEGTSQWNSGWSVGGAGNKAANTENQLVLIYWARTNYVSNEDALSGDIVVLKMKTTMEPLVAYGVQRVLEDPPVRVDRESAVRIENRPTPAVPSAAQKDASSHGSRVGTVRGSTLT